MIGFVIGLIVGGAIVYVYHAAIKAKVDEAKADLTNKD